MSCLKNYSATCKVYYLQLTLSKMTQNSKIRAYLIQNFMGHDKKRFSDPMPLTFEVWGLKNSLRKFGPKAFGKRLMKTLVQNPGSNF